MRLLVSGGKHLFRRLSTRLPRATMATELKPPIAEQRPHKVAFGAVEGENRGENPFKPIRYLSDPWFWLRDDSREKEDVIGYMRKENEYTEERTKHLKKFQTKLYDEHISHLKETDDDAPYPHGDFFYYSRTVKGLSYKIHCRKATKKLEELPTTEEQVILDVNKLAEGKAQCVVSSVCSSPDHTLCAYTVDFTGNETYSVHIFNINTGEVFTDQLEGCSGDIEWGNDNTVLFYVTEDAAKRPYKMWRHVIGTPQSDDVCLFTEEDAIYYFWMCKTKDNKYLLACSGSSETSEKSFIDLKGEDATTLTVIQKRTKGLRYSVEHIDGKFLIWTNKDEAINNRLMITDVATPGKDNWKEVIPYDATRKIDDVEVFSTFIALDGRQDGLTQCWTMRVTDGNFDASSFKKIEWPEEMYKCGLSVNKIYDSTTLRTHYTSLTTPQMWQDYDINTGSFTLVKQREVLNFDSSKYTCKRIFAKANDGTKIPMSMVHLKKVNGKDIVLDSGDNPTFLYGYGSYGMCVDPGFDPRILPYVDRGVVYVIAHIRGGGEMGRYWYEEQGKYLNKRNTFSDFVNCAEHLIDTKVTNPEKLACEGRSAGGLLMGTVLNMRPDLFKVAVAGVPFVDIMNTMCDPSIPLTTGEWEEWGNPNESKYYDYMMSYSPYDNVREQPYPHILITCGLHDPRVAYWEPVKWGSKLKTMKMDDNEILLKIELEAGHFSASDRYKYLREKAFDQSFVFQCLGMIDEDCKET